MIAWYITTHGLGHAVRACSVIRELPAEIPVTVRAAVSRWFLDEELGVRPFEHALATFDVGLLGPDSTHTDWRWTLQALEAQLDFNDAALEAEVAWLRASGARVVVSDVPSLPLRAARAAGLPSVLVANFTWSAVYAHYAENLCTDPELAGRFRGAVERIQREYDDGDLLLEPGMAVPQRACRERRAIPLIARTSQARRSELCAEAELDPERPVCLIYLGQHGARGLNWRALDELEPWQFVAFLPVPEPDGGVVKAVRALGRTPLPHCDVVASADVVLAKTGYGICGDAIAAGTPVVFPPRPEFIEYDAARDLMRHWGGGVEMPLYDLQSLDWRDYLDRAYASRGRMRAIRTDGAAAAAEIIMGFVDPQDGGRG